MVGRGGKTCQFRGSAEELDAAEHLAVEFTFHAYTSCNQ
jgi:hypothetical protein